MKVLKKVVSSGWFIFFVIDYVSVLSFMHNLGIWDYLVKEYKEGVITTAFYYVLSPLPFAIFFLVLAILIVNESRNETKSTTLGDMVYYDSLSKGEGVVEAEFKRSLVD